MVRKRHRRRRMGSGWETGRQRQSKSRRPFLKAQGVGRGGTRGWQKDVSTRRARRHVTAGPRKNEVSVTDRAGAAGIHTGEWKGGEGGGLSSPAPPPVPRPSIRHSTLGVGDSHSSCRADAAAFSERATLRTIGPPVADPLRGTVGLTANASQNSDRVPYSPHRIADGGATLVSKTRLSVLFSRVDWLHAPVLSTVGAEVEPASAFEAQGANEVRWQRPHCELAWVYLAPARSWYSAYAVT